MKDLIKSYFTFSKKELNGILVLFILLSISLTLPYILRYFDGPEVYDPGQFKKGIALFRASAVRPVSYRKAAESAGKKTGNLEAFVFNPNGLPESQWQRLGLSVSQIRVIKNYEAKGGKFFRKDDLKKIYSISQGEYLRLEPYIRIPSVLPAVSTVGDRPRQVKKLELNSADSAALGTLPGIGPVFASRIIRFRDRLGGFYSKEQLREVYGLDSLRYRQLRDRVEADTSLISKIEINTVSFEQLKRHPYLNYKQVNAVLRYREQHGRYLSAGDLRKVIALDEEIIRKIEPYLSF